VPTILGPSKDAVEDAADCTPEAGERGAGVLLQPKPTAATARVLRSVCRRRIAIMSSALSAPAYAKPEPRRPAGKYLGPLEAGVECLRLDGQERGAHGQSGLRAKRSTKRKTCAETKPLHHRNPHVACATVRFPCKSAAKGRQMIRRG
jgi:hypothetical protein